MPRAAFWLAPQDRFKVYASLAVLGAVILVAAGSLIAIVAFTWPAAGFAPGSLRIHAGSIDRFQVGQPVVFPEGKFWLVKQPDGSFVALYWKTPGFRGCTMPWRESFSFTDPRDGQTKQGWFRDPCSGSTFDINGVRVFGPSPRDMDRFAVEVVGGEVWVRAGESNVIRRDPDVPFWAR